VTKAAPELSLVRAWQAHDPAIAADAIALWRRLDALPAAAPPEERVKELCAAAYLGDEMVGVSTIALGPLRLLKGRFGLFRCLVVPEHRHQGVGRKLVVYSRALLAEWSKDHPEEKVLGMAAIVESTKLDALGKNPVWTAPGVHGLTLIGYTAGGRQIRVSWFEHARLD
jgi:GNAT superfamily N-acetyltransferase